MAGQHNFEHLPLLLRYQGRARLRGFGTPSPQTLANRNARRAHSTSLTTSAQSLNASWETRKAQSQEQGVPVIPQGIPILLQVDPSLEFDVLREKFEFEIVAEQEEGYVIVAAEDIQLTPFLAMVNGFAVPIHGSATIAQVHRLFDDPTQADRLRRILSNTVPAPVDVDSSTGAMTTSPAPSEQGIRGSVIFGLYDAFNISRSR